MANKWNLRLATFTLAYFLAGYACAQIPENNYSMVVIWPVVLLFFIIDLYQIYLILSRKGKLKFSKNVSYQALSNTLKWEELKSKLGDGDRAVEEVLDILSSLTLGTQFRNEFIMLKRRWCSLQEESYSHIKSYEEIKREKHRIIRDLLGMLDKMNSKL